MQSPEGEQQGASVLAAAEARQSDDMAHPGQHCKLLLRPGSRDGIEAVSGGRRGGESAQVGSGGGGTEAAL